MTLYMNTKESFIRGSKAYDDNDFVAALAALLPLAESGHAEAQYVIGDMYRWSHGVEQDSEISLRYLKASADQNVPKAAFDLFFLLSPGSRPAPDAIQSIAKDAGESDHYLGIAVARFRLIAESGDADAMSHLGFLYHHGWGVKRDGVQAIQWYAKAFDAGALGSANNLSLVYYKGDVRVRDKEKARWWYMKAKELKCQFVGIHEFEPDG